MIRELLAKLRRWRSAITGRFVSADYAKDNPNTTISERRN